MEEWCGVIKQIKNWEGLEKLPKLARSIGLGEMILQNITREGEMQGLDLEVIPDVSPDFDGPIVLTGGMTDLDELKDPANQKYIWYCHGFILCIFRQKKGRINILS